MMETKLTLQIHKMDVIILILQLDNMIVKWIINMEDDPVEDSTPMDEKIEMLQKKVYKRGRDKRYEF